MFSYAMLNDLARIYRKERWEEARIARLAEEVRAGSPRHRDRFLSRSGELLIFVGQKLRNRYGLRVEPRLTSERALSDGLFRDC